jgi:aspartyl-tRNA(Asn)/glutamyl-tRNA(Gln) amidotransferase subunit A
MMRRVLAYLSAAELHAGYGAAAFSPVEVLDAVAERIERVEPQLKAYVTLALDAAYEQARAAEAAYRRGEARALEGIPLAVKDLFDTAGIASAYGSAMYREHVPERDAEAVARARAAGAVVVGKTSTHEFAWGITSYNAAFDSGRNPWALDRVSGGSSGGSAAALATHTCTLALGTDTGGSVRIPAGFCGVVGFKPTYGLAPVAGIFPLAPSLDHCGVLTRTPQDAALLLSVIAGRPVACSPLEPGVRIAVCPELMPEPPLPGVGRAFEAALEALRSLGAAIVECHLPEARDVVATYAPIQNAEALEVHRRAGTWPARSDEYGPDVHDRLRAAEELTLADYREAAIRRERLRVGLVRAFGTTDLIVTPVAPIGPVRRGEMELDYDGRRRLFRDLVLPYTVPHDLAGLPTCALRAGFDDDGLPTGVQLAGPPGADERVLGAAAALFAATRGVQERWPEA